VAALRRRSAAARWLGLQVRIPLTAWICFVWIWEQAAIISLYSINWLVFITERKCVYCAVRTGFSTVAAPVSHQAFNACDAPHISVVLRSHMYLHCLSGTQWCGNGNRARDAEDLGLFKKTDDCCRTHDNCPDNIRAGHSRHGLNNSGLFTRWAAQSEMGKGNYFRGSSSTDDNRDVTIWKLVSTEMVRRCFLGCPVETRTCRDLSTSGLRKSFERCNQSSELNLVCGHVPDNPQFTRQ
jgi:secretory phospholipase A2